MKKYKMNILFNLGIPFLGIYLVVTVIWQLKYAYGHALKNYLVITGIGRNLSIQNRKPIKNYDTNIY